MKEWLFVSRHIQSMRPGGANHIAPLSSNLPESDCWPNYERKHAHAGCQVAGLSRGAPHLTQQNGERDRHHRPLP